MSKLEVLRPARRRVRVSELHPHLMCILCGGYYVDATTIIECLHSFCKSCLVRYLESSKYCPICEVQVHKTKPLLNIRPDETLQNMVYKLVPGLFQREMKFRQDFYAQHPDAPPSSAEDRGIVDPIECQFYSPEEPVSLALEFKSDVYPPTNSNGLYKRYLRCPAAVTVAHLQKLVRNKYDLEPRFAVDVMFDDKLMMPDLSIMDIAYSFQRKRKEQFHFTYRIVDVQCKKMRLDPCAQGFESMDVDPPTILQSIPSVENKVADTPSQPEIKSKLDSIISRLGIAKQSEIVVKKEKTSDEWKEVQLQISENGIMSVTDISCIDKLINTTEKITGPTENIPELSLPLKTEPVQEKEVSVSDVKIEKERANCQVNSRAHSSIAAVKKDQRKNPGSPSTSNQPKDKIQSPKTSTKRVETDKLSTSVEPSEKDEEKTVVHSDPKETKVISSSSSKTPSPKVTPTSAPQNIPLQRVQVSSNSSASSSQSNAATGQTSKLCTVTSGTNQISQSVLSSVSAISSVCAGGASLPSVVVSSTATSKPVSSALTTTTAARIAPVSVAKQLPSAPIVKKSSSPVGYKTLKCGPKNWNPTISRNSFLSSKMEQQPQQGGSSTSAAGSKPTTPPRFFKMRNTPRYLGNPASGVKAMYQIPDAKPETPPPAKSPSVMKLDPRTLTPIVSNASSPTSKSPSGQPKGRPPFPSTTLSAQVSNHMPSSRSVATTTPTTSSSTKLNDLSSLRSSSNQPLVNPFLSHPFVPKGMPNFLYGGVPGLLPPGAQFASMLRPGLGYPPVTATGFHPTLPQTASMLFSPHQLHRQLNSSSPSSPSPYPSSLASSSAMSLPLSSSPSSSTKSSATNQRVAVSIPSTQSSPNRSNRTVMSPLGQESSKLNGSDVPKVTASKTKPASSANVEQSSSQGKVKETSSSNLRDTRTLTSSVSDNNNTLQLQTEKDSSKVSKSVSKETVKCGEEQLISRSKNPTNSSFQAQHS